MAWHGTKTLNETRDGSHDTDVLLKEIIGGSETVFPLIKTETVAIGKLKKTMKRKTYNVWLSKYDLDAKSQR
jgi:hypothetical protein